MYQWVLWLHVSSILGFVLFHGVSAVAVFRLRGEQSPERAKALLQLSTYPANLAWISLGVLLVTGIALGFLGHWWSWGWIWVSIGVLVAVIVGMSLLGSKSMNIIRGRLGMPTSYGEAPDPSLAFEHPGQLSEHLARLPIWPLSGLGFGGLLVIVWLMMFKPF